MSNAQTDLFWEFPLEVQPATAPEQQPPAATLAPEPAATTDEPLLLRSVGVDAVAMARALVLIKSFAAKYGVDVAERAEVSMFVRERDILFAADWDRGHTLTAEGEARPFRFRYSVPLADTGEGRALWAGARIRPQDLQEAFRNRVENSDQYGVLTSADPIRLEVFSAPVTEEAAAYPARILVHPTSDGRLEPREVFTLGGASLRAYEDVEPVLADAGVAGLDAEALVDMAALADDAIGIRIHPWNHIEQRRDNAQPTSCLSAYAVAVGARGVAITNFDGPLTERFITAGSQVEILEQGVEVERTPEPDGNALRDDIVISPRFADVLGITQGSFEEAMKVIQRPISADWELKIAAAAVAATLDANPELADRLREQVGAAVVLPAWKAATGRDCAARAIAAVRRLQGQVAPADLANAATLLPSVDASAVESFAAEFAGDADLARIAAHLHVADDAETLLARAIGRVLLTTEAKRVISQSGDAHQSETATTVDIALAALRLGGKTYRTIAEDAVKLVSDPATWWNDYARYMAALGVPADAIENVTRTERGALRTERPTARSLRPAAKIREGWLAQAKVPVQGRIWRAEDGRSWAGFGHDEVGFVWFSDKAVQADPAKYPLQHSEITELVARSLRSGERKLSAQWQWQATLHRDDLQAVVNRVVGLINPDTEVSPKALLVARYTPAEQGRPDGMLPAQDPRFSDESAMLRPTTVYLGEGPNAQRFEVDPGYDMTKIRDAADGTLRVYGFEAGGESLWFEVPMFGGSESVRPEGREAGEPYAFALDAEGLHDAIDFVGRRGQSSTINLLDGVVRVHDPQMRRLLFVPTVQRSRVPEEYRAALRAAGVPAVLGTPVPLTDVIAHARKATVKVDETRTASRPSRAASIAWAPMPAPGAEVAEEVYTAGALDPFIRYELVRRRIERLERDLADFEQELPDMLGQVQVTTKRNAGHRTWINRQLKAARAELEQIMEELPAHMQMSDDVAVRQTRPGQGKRRFATLDQIAADDTELDGVEPPQEEKPVRRR